MALRCLLVDDSALFLNAAAKLLQRQGLDVVGVASTPAEALKRLRELEPDVTIIDVNLDGASGFDLASRLAASTAGAGTPMILTSSRSEEDLAELIAVTPVLGFVPKTQLSADAIRDFLTDRSHGHGCRHEALVYSSADELATGTLPFVREGLARDERLLVVLRDQGAGVLRQALGGDASRIEFADAVPWYQSPEHAFQRYTRYLDEHLGRGAPRVRVVAEVVWPQNSATTEIAGWKRYEAGISVAMASVPVSFICAYDMRELPVGTIRDAARTHPVMRTVDGPRASGRYAEPAAFVRGLGA
jgi:two-component system nitrate/nitrite response regulator NarL